MANKKLIIGFLLVIAVIIFIVNSILSKREKPREQSLENAEQVACDDQVEKIESINQSFGWEPLPCGLWKNKYGDIGFKTMSVVCSDGLGMVDTYITRIGFDEHQSLKEIIDTATFRELGASFYKDKFHIYRHYSMSGGGDFHVFDEADYKTFEVLTDCYAKDKNHIYESRAGALKNVDYKTFKTKPRISGCIAKDKDGIIAWGEHVKPEELQDETLKKLIKHFESE